MFFMSNTPLSNVDPQKGAVRPTIDQRTTYENGMLKIRSCKELIFMKYKQLQLDRRIY